MHAHTSTHPDARRAKEPHSHTPTRILCACIRQAIQETLLRDFDVPALKQGGLTVHSWWELITAHIDRMHELEVLLATELRRYSYGPSTTNAAGQFKTSFTLSPQLNRSPTNRSPTNCSPAGLRASPPTRSPQSGNTPQKVSRLTAAYADVDSDSSPPTSRPAAPSVRRLPSGGGSRGGSPGGSDGYEHDNGVGSDSFKKALAQAARGGSANGAGGSGAEEEKQQELRRQVGREIARLPADEVKNYVLEMFGCTDATAMSHAQAPSPVDADRSSPAAIGSKVQIVSPLDVAVGGVGRRSTDPLDLFEDDPDSIEGRSTAPPRLSSAPAALAADDRHISLDELTFQRRIGSGGFSTTYLARWSKNQQRTVAVKVASSVGDSLEQWRVEVRSLTRLVHPNIIRYLGYVASAPTYCLVLEYCEGGDLYETLRSRSGGTPPGFTMRVGSGIAAALAYLHGLRVMHRDLKSPNVLLDFGPPSARAAPDEPTMVTPKLTDFGVSADLPDTTLSRGSLLTAETGTYRWMAPEVMRHEPYSASADVYSWAMVMYELITHDIPFASMEPLQAAAAVALENKRPPLPAQTPVALGRLMRDAWRTVRSERPSAKDLVHMLDEFDASMSEADRAWVDCPDGHPPEKMSTVSSTHAGREQPPLPPAAKAPQQAAGASASAPHELSAGGEQILIQLEKDCNKLQQRRSPTRASSEQSIVESRSFGSWLDTMQRQVRGVIRRCVA